MAKVTQASGVLRLDNKGGKVINISSRMGSVEATLEGGYFRCATYSASKAAQNMMTACLAMEHPHLVFLMVNPGWVQTDMGGAGGRTADITVQESASGIFSVFKTLDKSMSGKFFDWKGDEVSF